MIKWDEPYEPGFGIWPGIHDKKEEEMTINYGQTIDKFHKMLREENWPKVVFIPPADYWAIIIASEGVLQADWHFDNKDEDEGFAFFLLGPTMVRPCKRRANAVEFTELERRRKPVSR